MLLWLGLLIISMSLSHRFTGLLIVFGEYENGSREAAEPVHTQESAPLKHLFANELF
jgi:hypothetical protein